MKQLKSFDFTDAQRKKLASIILKLDKEKQDILVSGDNIATINGQSLLNGGNISLSKTGIFSIVTELPTNDINKDKIYLVPSKETNDENKFSEYIYTDNGWEKLGTITAEIDLSNCVQHTDVVTDTTNGLMLASDKTKLDGIEERAQVNKIESVSVNGTPLEITNKGVDIPNATTEKDGTMSKADKAKLDSLENYTLPVATTTTLGGVKVPESYKPNPPSPYVSNPLILTEEGNLILRNEHVDGNPENMNSSRFIKFEASTNSVIGSFRIYNVEYSSYGNAKLGLISKSYFDKFKAKQDALTEIQLNNINNAITSISINNIEQVNTNGAVDLTIPNASITENGLMSKEDKAKLDSQPTIKASDATGVTDDDYVVIKKSELDSILSRLSALEYKA